MPKNQPLQSPQVVPYELAIGQHLPGHESYKNQGLLGRGGMGSVYKMVRGELEFVLAVKIMHRDLAELPPFVKLFLEEARILKQVGDHENLVRILDYAKLSDGVPFIVMELLEGRSLGSAMRAHALAHKPFDRSAALKIVHDICAGVFELHSQGIVHRDMKPDNVFLKEDGAVKILDCGLAYKRVIDPRAPDADQGTPFQKGAVQGTPKYMAPEQARGEEVSPQSDTYSIALILAEMLLGRLPYDLPAGASQRQLMDAHLWLSPLPLTQFLDWVSPAFNAVVLQALDKDPGKRPRSAYEFQTKIYAEAERLRTGRAPEIGTASDANITTPTPMTFEELGLAADEPRPGSANRTQPLLRKETMRMETAPTHPAAGGMWAAASPVPAPIGAPVVPAVASPPAAVHPTPDPRLWPSQHVVSVSPAPQPVADARSVAATPPVLVGRPLDPRSSQPWAPSPPRSNPSQSAASTSDTGTPRSLSYETPVDVDSLAMGRTVRRRIIIRSTVALAVLALSGLLIVATLRLATRPASSAVASASTTPPVRPALSSPPPGVTSSPAPAPSPASASSSSSPAASAASGPAAPAASSSPIALPTPTVPKASAAARTEAPRAMPVRAKPKPAASDGSDELFRPWPGGH